MKKFIIALLCLITAFGTLSCSDCRAEEKPAEENSGMQLLNGFEDFERDVQLLHLLNRFGTADMNRDEKYIRSGKGSLKLRPLGYAFNNASPTIVVRTYSTRFDFGYTDFTSVDKVCVSAYNAEETPVNMGISFVFDNGSMTSKRLEVVGQSVAEWYSLKPGWNDIVMSVNSDYLSLQRSAKLDRIYGVAFKFDAQSSFDINDAPTIYLDDLYLHYAENKHAKSLSLKTNAEKGVYEVADFENTDQKYFFTPTGPIIEVPEISIVSAAGEGLIAKSGIMVMKVAKKAGLGDGGYPYVYFSSEAMQKAMENAGEDIKLHPEAYSFKFDVYNASAVDQNISVDFSVKTQSGLRWCATNSAVVAKAGAWSVYEYNFARMNTAYINYLKRETERLIVSTVLAERENGKEVALTDTERADMLRTLNLDDEGVLAGLRTENPRQTEFTQTEKDDYILKNYLFGLTYEEARAFMLDKDVMLTADFKTLYDCKSYTVTQNPNDFRMLFSKYLASESQADRVLYFDNFRIEKTGDSV